MNHKNSYLLVIEYDIWQAGPRGKQLVWRRDATQGCVSRHTFRIGKHTCLIYVMHTMLTSDFSLFYWQPIFDPRQGLHMSLRWAEDVLGFFRLSFESFLEA